MNYLMPEEIARRTDHLEGQANIRAINRLFRRQDESHLWPISGKFNATDRAIRRAQKFVRESGQIMYGLEYCYFLDSEISQIVNNPKNQ
jgi:hypothetical protein